MQRAYALIFVVLCLGLSAPAATLKLGVAPKSPVIVTSGTLSNGAMKVTAPYFMLSNIALAVEKKTEAEIIAVRLRSRDQKSVNCLIAGDELKQVFLDHVNKRGAIIIRGPNVALNLNALGCGDLKLARNAHPDFDIPVRVTVIGVALSSRDVPKHQVTASADILLR